MRIIALFLLISIVALSLLSACTRCSELREYRNVIRELEIEDVDITTIPDGTYSGFADAGLVSALVAVTVKSGKIEEIELIEHQHGRGAEAEIISENVVQAQSLDVEYISGATSSSKIILKAIERALVNQEPYKPKRR
jgi:uncharacterized protein with FMN-binding domain